MLQYLQNVGCNNMFCGKDVSQYQGLKFVLCHERIKFISFFPIKFGIYVCKLSSYPCWRFEFGYDIWSAMHRFSFFIHNNFNSLKHSLFITNCSYLLLPLVRYRSRGCCCSTLLVYFLWKYFLFWLYSWSPCHEKIFEIQKSFCQMDIWFQNYKTALKHEKDIVLILI